MVRKIACAVACVAMTGGAASAQPLRPKNAIPQKTPANAPATGTNTPQDVPGPAKPNVKKKNSFFGLPLLALLGAGGAGAAVAATTGNASPQ